MKTEKFTEKSQDISTILPWFKELFIYHGDLHTSIIYPSLQRRAFIDLTAIISLYDYEQKCLVNDEFKNYTFIILNNEDPHRASYGNKPNLILYTKEEVLKMMADAYKAKEIFLNNAKERAIMVNTPEITGNFNNEEGKKSNDLVEKERQKIVFKPNRR